MRTVTLFFFVRGQGESQPKRSRRTKDLSVQSVLLALKIYKQREIKILSAILQSNFKGFKFSKHIQTYPNITTGKDQTTTLRTLCPICYDMSACECVLNRG